jgi:hypothetical protein
VFASTACCQLPNSEETHWTSCAVRSFMRILLFCVKIFAVGLAVDVLLSWCAAFQKKPIIIK